MEEKIIENIDEHSVVPRICVKHNLIFISNLYGDEINVVSPLGKTYRSEWKCTECGKIKYKQYLNRTGSEF